MQIKSKCLRMRRNSQKLRHYHRSWKVSTKRWSRYEGRIYYLSHTYCVTARINSVRMMLRIRSRRIKRRRNNWIRRYDIIELQALTLTNEEKYEIAQFESDTLKKNIEDGRIKSDQILESLRVLLIIFVGYFGGD